MKLPLPTPFVDDPSLQSNLDAIAVAFGALPRFVFGQVSSTGAVARGVGFSSVRNSAGNYTVTFTNAFTTLPVVTLTPVSGVIARVSGAPALGSFVISTLDAAFANADFDTAFVAVGT